MYKGKGNRGVITVLISLLLVGVLSVGTVAIEAGRYQAAKTQLAESGISVSTSMIAAYDSALYARYGLLAMETERFTPERATDYLTFNADQAIGYRGNNLSRLYAIDSVELTGLYNLTYPMVMQRQILSRAKYHIVPQDHAFNVSTMDAFLTEFLAKCDVVYSCLSWPVIFGSFPEGTASDVPADMKNALKLMSETYATIETADPECDILLTGSTVSLLPSRTGMVETDVPDEDLVMINSAHIDAVPVLGGAGAGLNNNAGPVANQTAVTIPMQGGPESLNAAMAAGILMWEMMKSGG